MDPDQGYQYPVPMEPTPGYDQARVQQAGNMKQAGNIEGPETARTTTLIVAERVAEDVMKLETLLISLEERLGPILLGSLPQEAQMKDPSTPLVDCSDLRATLARVGREVRVLQARVVDLSTRIDL